VKSLADEIPGKAFVGPLTVKEDGDAAISGQAHDAPLCINTGPDEGMLLVPCKLIDLFHHAERVGVNVVTRRGELFNDRLDVPAFVDRRIIEARREGALAVPVRAGGHQADDR